MPGAAPGTGMEKMVNFDSVGRNEELTKTERYRIGGLAKEIKNPSSIFRFYFTLSPLDLPKILLKIPLF